MTSDPNPSPKQLVFQVGFNWYPVTSPFYRPIPVNGPLPIYPLSFVFLLEADSGSGTAQQIYKPTRGSDAFDCQKHVDDSKDFCYACRVGDSVRWEIFDLSAIRQAGPDGTLHLAKLHLPFSREHSQGREQKSPFLADGYKPPRGLVAATDTKACALLPGADSRPHPFWTPPSGAMKIRNLGTFSFTISFDIVCEGEVRKFRVDPEMIVGEAGSSG